MERKFKSCNARADNPTPANVDIDNKHIAELLGRYADLLEIDGTDEFRLRAYRFAVEELEQQSTQMADLVRQGKRLEELAGIGKAIAAKIKAIVDTGRLPQMEELEARVAPIYLDLLKVPGLGIKRVKALRVGLHLETREDLEQALDSHAIANLPGFGNKTEELIAAKFK